MGYNYLSKFYFRYRQRYVFSYFKIIRVDSSQALPMYEIQMTEEPYEIIDGRFYRQELQKVDHVPVQKRIIKEMEARKIRTMKEQPE